MNWQPPRADRSLHLIEPAGTGPGAAFIDVGGASTPVGGGKRP